MPPSRLPEQPARPSGDAPCPQRGAACPQRILLSPRDAVTGRGVTSAPTHLKASQPEHGLHMYQRGTGSPPWPPPLQFSATLDAPPSPVSPRSRLEPRRPSQPPTTRGTRVTGASVTAGMQGDVEEPDGSPLLAKPPRNVRHGPRPGSPRGGDKSPARIRAPLSHRRRPQRSRNPHEPTEAEGGGRFTSPSAPTRPGPPASPRHPGSCRRRFLCLPAPRA